MSKQRIQLNSLGAVIEASHFLNGTSSYRTLVDYTEEMIKRNAWSNCLSVRVGRLSVKEVISRKLPRKIITAAITVPIYAILLALVTPYFYESNVYSLWRYLGKILVTTQGYILYSFPAILLYGVFTSSSKRLTFIQIHEKWVSKVRVFSIVTFSYDFRIIITLD